MLGGMIAHYRIVGEIDAGGMGVVYRAHDPRLERDVALKVLRAETLDDQTARARLLREARLAATLNHPNICTVYEVGEDAGRVFIAMELVEGRPLSERLAERGGGEGLPTESVARYGAQLAAALAHAHERHVIHRDLKSSNVVVLADGRVKVLDFGLARRLWEGPDQAAQAPQVTLTETGMLIGTPHYLAPEVLRGNKADERSDLWALGVLLHEMACGALPFRGRTGFELTAAILNDPPAPLPARIPAGLRAVIGRCLAKEPGERYQRASEVQAALETIENANPPAPGPSPTARLRRMVSTAARVAAIALLLAGGWFAWRRFAPRPQPEERQLTTNPMGFPILGAAISPDGRSLFYADSTGMYLKDIASGETQGVPPPPGVRFGLQSLGWFPDGTRLIVATDSRTEIAAAGVWQVSLVGWNWRRLSAEGRFAAVSPDGDRIAFTRDSTIWVMSADGQDASRVHSLERGWQARGLAWGPGGARIAYIRYPAWDPRIAESIETLDPARRDVSVIVTDARLAMRFGRSVPPLWMRDGRILYALCDSNYSLNVTLWQGRVGSRDGRLRGRPDRYARIPSSVQAISASTDGRRVVVLKSFDQMDVQVADLEAGARRLLVSRRLTLDDSNDWLESWSTDSRSVLYNSDRRGLRAVFRQRLDQSTSEVAVSSTHAHAITASETPDGRWILFWQKLPRAPTGTGRIMRTASAGGPASTIMEYSRNPVIRCPSRPGAECVICEADSSWSVFSTLDPERGRGREVARIARGLDGYCFWALSPDGTRLALIVPDERNTIRVMDLGTGRTTVIRTDLKLQHVSFAGASERDGLIATAFTKILHVDAAGKVTPLHQADQPLGNPQVSPDGKHLAWGQLNMGANAWLLATP